MRALNPARGRASALDKLRRPGCGDGAPRSDVKTNGIWVPAHECNLMDERLKFIAGLLDGEKIAVLCRRFGVSWKTGYKILDRDKRA